MNQLTQILQLKSSTASGNFKQHCHQWTSINFRLHNIFLLNIPSDVTPRRFCGQIAMEDRYLSSVTVLISRRIYTDFMTCFLPLCQKISMSSFVGNAEVKLSMQCLQDPNFSWLSNAAVAYTDLLICEVTSVWSVICLKQINTLGVKT